MLQVFGGHWLEYDCHLKHQNILKLKVSPIICLIVMKAIYLALIFFKEEKILYKKLPFEDVLKRFSHASKVLKRSFHKTPIVPFQH